ARLCEVPQISIFQGCVSRPGPEGNRAGSWRLTVCVAPGGVLGGPPGHQEANPGSLQVDWPLSAPYGELRLAERRLTAERRARVGAPGGVPGLGGSAAPCPAAVCSARRQGRQNVFVDERMIRAQRSVRSSPPHRRLPGCLFEKRLCSRGQLCLDDALFGQCQDPTQQRVQYQVSVPVLQKLQDVLKQLMMQGLSWQDNIVQYVISKELSRVPQTHVPARPRDVPPSQPSQPWDKPSSKSRAEVDRLSPAVAQRYLDYMPSSRHEVATAVSASPFYGDLDFPLDYTEDLIVQEEQLSSERQHKKAPQHYSAISGLDDVTLNRMASVLKRHGIDVKSLSLQQLDALAAALRARPSDGLEDPDRLQGVEVSEKKLTEGSMTHKAEGAPIPAPSIASLSLALQPLGQSVDAGAGVALPRQGGVMGGGAMEPKASELIGDELPKAEDSKDASPALVTGVGAPVREEYGYIVTSQRPLSLFDGVQLLETLANKIKIPVSTFINISVVGPALMFRLRQNQQNMSASDPRSPNRCQPQHGVYSRRVFGSSPVAEKTFLESQTGLKILQTGVGEALRVTPSPPCPPHGYETWVHLPLSTACLSWRTDPTTALPLASRH
ncbi:hypothetical protein Z043_111067, partial [Scleropages formosus]